METRAHRERRRDFYLDDKGERAAYVDLQLTPSRLAVLETLAEFRDLNTEMLYQHVNAKLGRDVHRGWLQNSLTDLRKRAGYLSCYPAQYETVNADYKELIYRLTDRGRKFVERKPHISSSSFFHDWMAAHVVASLRLMAHHEQVPFIEPLEILSRVPALKHPYAFPVELPWNGKTIQHRSSPDYPIFGLNVGEENPLFIWLEIDCATEDGESDEVDYSNITQKIACLHELTKEKQGDHQFWKRVKLPDIMFLFITTEKYQKRAIIESVKRVCGTSPRFLVKTMPHFRRIDYTPQPMADLWYTGWERVGYPPFFFNAKEE